MWVFLCHLVCKHIGCLLDKLMGPSAVFLLQSCNLAVELLSCICYLAPECLLYMHRLLRDFVLQENR